jgi:Na+:H+ antiporter, NhaA family
LASKKSLKNQFPLPPEASATARKVALKVVAPVDRFLSQQTSSGFILLGMAAIALIWANSPWGASYGHLWHTPVTIGVGAWTMTQSLHFWINDFLMTFFFMVAGFEIKREMAEGELSDLRRAALPIAAAVGGMLVPAAIYIAFNPGGDTFHGWGIPMATDIAFALGILVLLGDRVPAALRILLLALAIIDDLGAILVIAIFYSSGFALSGLVAVAVGCVVLFLFLRIGIRPGAAYFVPLMIIWAGLYKAGVHPTIAGVIVGMSAPVRPWFSREQFLGIAQHAIQEFQEHAARKDHSEDDLLAPLDRLTLVGREAVSPVVRLENQFHGWVAFFIMPLFALANAGVSVGDMDFSDSSVTPLMLGISLGLVVGKPLGVILVSWILVRLGWARLPRGVTWSGMLVLGLCAGIGFTMSIFIDELAFKGAPMFIGAGKLAILVATAMAAGLALILGRLMLSKMSPDVAALTAAEAEASNEY